VLLLLDATLRIVEVLENFPSKHSFSIRCSSKHQNESEISNDNSECLRSSHQSLHKIHTPWTQLFHKIIFFPKNLNIKMIHWTCIKVFPENPVGYKFIIYNFPNPSAQFCFLFVYLLGNVRSLDLQLLFPWYRLLWVWKNQICLHLTAWSHFYLLIRL
jgi:hypothetical protein